MAKKFLLAVAGACTFWSCAAGPPSFDLTSPAPAGDFDADAREGGIRLLGSAGAHDNAGVAPSRDGAALEAPTVARADSGARDSSATDARSASDAKLANDVVSTSDARFESDVASDDARPSFDTCFMGCRPNADHLLLSEIVTRPNGSEMIEIVNPTRIAVDLSNYWLSDSHLYERIASSGFSTASGSDFAARFPLGATIGPGEYRSVSLANASGGSVSFVAAYGKKPDFELRPTSNSATNDADVPDMLSSDAVASIGANASLTDGGEPVVLFYWAGDPIVYDVDYLFFGTASISNAIVDKTSEPGYRPDTPLDQQHAVPAPGETEALHRCDFSEPDERRGSGNGLTGHDETSEDVTRSFVVTNGLDLRTPGGPPPSGACELNASSR